MGKVKNYLRFPGELLLLFLALAIAQVLPKPIFLAIYTEHFSLGAAWDVIVNGFDVDCTIAGYLSIFPALIGITAIFFRDNVINVLRRILNIYLAVAALLTAIIFTLNIALYGHWGFPLDATPVFYFTSSPSAAMASVTAGETIVGIIAILLYSALLYPCFRRVATVWPLYSSLPGTNKVLRTLITVCSTAILFIPIRGGFTVSTMNPSRAYFSEDKLLNHAAANPMFTLLYSLNHQNDFSSQFRFMEPQRAEAIFNAMTDRGVPASPSAADSLLTNRRPDVYIIILESFSSHLFPSLGGEPVAMQLDSVARDGILFSGIYASSFRTDRALPAVLSGFPGQPNTSIMKYADKIEKIPSIARSLRNVGWETAYYYGGDINFTNMMAYLVSSGFSTIIKDTDFPLSERTGKWGVHDGPLFARCLADLRAHAATGATQPKERGAVAPRLTVIQTSSSHEPFEVPYSSKQSDKAANAFAYTDSVTAAFLNELKKLPDYSNSLIILVPDHYGAYPKGLMAEEEKHKIPIILTGGALVKRGFIVDRIGSQTDLAATLLAMLGLDNSEFQFSRNLFAYSENQFAFFSSPTSVTLLTPEGTTQLDVETGKLSGPQVTNLQAYLQYLYARLSSL